MSFGQSAPPATAKQVQYLLSLVQKAGHSDFRDARGPLGLTQRQANGKFTRTEASAMIDRLLAEDSGNDGDGAGAADLSGAQISAADRLEAERASLLMGLPAGLLAAELERRGWTVTPPA
jgi:hypothetical protein